MYIFYRLIMSCRLYVRFTMQSCVHSFLFFFARPTDPPSQEGGRWETKHFMGMAKQEKWNSQKESGFPGQKTVQENPREHKRYCIKKTCLREAECQLCIHNSIHSRSLWWPSRSPFFPIKMSGTSLWFIVKEAWLALSKSAFFSYRSQKEQIPWGTSHW